MDDYRRRWDYRNHAHCRWTSFQYGYDITWKIVNKWINWDEILMDGPSTSHGWVDYSKMDEIRVWKEEEAVGRRDMIVATNKIIKVRFVESRCIDRWLFRSIVIVVDLIRSPLFLVPFVLIDFHQRRDWFNIWKSTREMEENVQFVEENEQSRQF